MKNIALSIYISKITHTLYFIIIYCNNLLLIIAILTLYIIMPNSVFIHNRCLAFSVNIIYIDDIIKHHEKLQSIEFTNFNINTINKTFSNYNQSLSNKDINIKYNHLILLINKLKTSGFINNLQFHLVDNETIKYKIIKITTNNLIKKIIVFRAKKLKIPGSLLSKYFELHLGLPCNFNILNTSMKNIYNWYRYQGFDHIYIELTKFNDDVIYINVYEGIIRKINFKCESQRYISKKFSNYIENRIKQELSIFNGDLANTKKIEVGIQKLKANKILSYCKYKILGSKNDLNIVLNYDIYQNNIQYISDKDISIKIKKNIYIDNNLYYPFSIYKDYIQNIIKRTLLRKIQLNLHILHNLLNRGSILSHNIINKNLGFKYSSLRYKNLIFSIKWLTHYPILNYLISYPHYGPTSNYFTSSLMKLYNNLEIRYFLYPLNINYIGHHNRNLIEQNIYKSMLKFQGINCKFQHSLLTYMNLYEAIDLIYKQNDKDFLSISRSQLYTNFLLKCQSKKSLKKIIKKSIRQVMINLRIHLQYNNFSTTIHTNSGTLFLCQIKSLIYLPFKKLRVFNLTNYINQYVNIQYHKIFILPTFIPKATIYHNTLILYTELYWPIINKSYLDISFRHYHKYAYIIDSSYGSLVYLLDLEYHAFLTKYYSLYIFFNNTNKEYKKIKTQKHIHLFSSYKWYKYVTNIGYGIQFNIPIPSIPILRIEYCISNQADKFLQLRIYSRYTEYNL